MATFEISQKNLFSKEIESYYKTKKISVKILGLTFFVVHEKNQPQIFTNYTNYYFGFKKISEICVNS